jgi:hypothetical protein
MEKRPYNPEENDIGPEAPSRKKRRTPLEVLRGWVHFRDTGRLLSDQAPQTPEEAEKKQKEERTTKGLSRILRRFVKKEKIRETSADKTDIPHILPGVEVASPPLTPEDTKKEQESAPDLDATADETLVGTSEQDVPQGEEETKEAPDIAAIRDNEVVVPLQPSSKERPAIQGTPDRPPAESASTPDTPYSHEVPTTPFEPAYQEQIAAMQSNAPPKEKEVVIEHGPSPINLFALGTEYTSRKRDKAIKKDQAAMRQDVAKLQKQQELTQFAQAELHKTQAPKFAEQQSPVVAPLIEAPSPKSAYTEHVGATPVPMAEKLPTKEIKQTTRPETVQQKPSQPESVKEILQTQTRERLRKAEQLIAKGHYENVDPIEVQKAAQLLAEQKKPLEEILERRHEIRGESDQGTQTAGAAGAYAHTPSLTPASSQSFVSPSARDPFATDSTAQRQGSTYKKAAVSGFVTALVVLAFLAALLFIR